MSTNIERAINKLIQSNQDITLKNALPAYLREAGFKKMSPDALIAFEHALDKCPTRADQSRAAFLKGISGISAEYWINKYTALADIPCSHCSTHVCRKFNLRAEAKARGYEYPGEDPRETPNCRLKSKRKRGRAHEKRDVATGRFDPFAPSTSAVML